MNGSAPTTAFLPVYAQGDPGIGIGGYDLQSAVDRSFAFDYDSSGNLDHIVLYRPGAGTIWILCNRGGQFSPVYTTGSGIGGYDLKSPADLAFAFDYEGSGKLDHLVLYRPGTGTIWILHHDGVQFSSVYAQGDPGNGIGGYDLKSTADRAFAFDYDGSGKLDHLAFYRPGTGTIWILSNYGGQFSSVYVQGDPGDGIGQYDLKSPADLAFAFDYDHSGTLDHLALYRPGTGTMWLLAQGTPVASSPVTPSSVTPSPVTPSPVTRSPVTSSSPVASLTPRGVITGAVVGGIVGLTAILVILFLCWRQQQTKNMSINQPYREPAILLAAALF